MPIDVQPMAPDQAKYKIPQSNIYVIGGREWYMGIWTNAALGVDQLCMVGFDTQGTQKWRFVVYETLSTGEMEDADVLITKWLGKLNSWIKELMEFAEPEVQHKTFLERMHNITYDPVENQFKEG